MNMFETMVRMRIDDLVGLAGRVRQERDLRAGTEAADTTVLAATTGGASEAPRTAPPVASAFNDGAETDCPECPSSVQAA
jgi:hypothetical protein